MNDETQAPFSEKGIRLRWSFLGKALPYLIALAAPVVMLSLSSVFVRKEEIEPFASLPARVEKLEDFKIEQRAQQNATNQSVGAIQQDMSGLKASVQALKEESTRNTDRILQRLDSLTHGK